MNLSKRDMPETLYRASRCCRALGNPSAYLILRFLGTSCRTPTEISEELGISMSSVSITLRHLRNLDLVRYETAGRTKNYWVKDPAVLKIMSALEVWVGKMRKKRL